jgi:hypothetical protein
VQRLTRRGVDAYSRQDPVRAWLDEIDASEAVGMGCDRWLVDSLPKRCVFHRLYGDLLVQGPRRRVLDIGGGLTRLTARLAASHDYVLSELLAHDSEQAAEAVERRVSRRFIVRGDWKELDGGDFDLVVANDLFPNVDQRLDGFIASWLPRCRRMRLSLTWYEGERSYRVRRIDADEQMCMVAWDAERLRHILRKWWACLDQPDERALDAPPEDIFQNGRQVCLVELRGMLAPRED